MTDFSSTVRRRRFGRGEKALLAAGAAALAWSAWTSASAWREWSRIQASVTEARGELEAVQARIQALERRNGPDQMLSSQALLTAEVPPPRVAAEIGALLPRDVRLEGLGLKYGRRVDVEMLVVARSAKSYDTFLERIESSPAFEDVVPGDENRDGELRAVVRAGYKGVRP